MINAKTYELLDQLEATPKGAGSRKAKEEILKNNREFLNEYFDIAQNSYRVFGLASLPKKFNLHKEYTAFEDLARLLEDKKGSQSNASKQFVRDVIEQQASIHPSAPKWCEAAILKKLTLGIEAKTLNKFGYNIPVFDCLLSDPNPKNLLTGTIYPCYSQVKFDGVRLLRFPGNIMLSRSGTTPANVNIVKHFQLNEKYEDYVLDGEFFSFKRNFNQIQSIFSKEEGEIPEDIKYVVFGVMLKETWDKQGKSMLYADQLELIEVICSESINLVSVSDYTTICQNEKEVRDMYAKHLENFEGSMVRNINSRYQWERVSVADGTITKLKPFDHADCTIKGVYEGEGKYEGMFGGFYLDYNGVEVKCGGGFKEHERIAIWADPSKYIGRMCRVKYTEITPDKSLRYPIWDSLRETK